MSEPQKQYYTISEVSTMLNLPMSTLHFWEQTFEALKPLRFSGTTRRFYSPKDIELLRQIKYMRQEQHMSLKAIAARLHTEDMSEIERREKAVETLKNLRAELIQIKQWIDNKDNYEAKD